MEGVANALDDGILLNSFEPITCQALCLLLCYSSQLHVKQALLSQCTHDKTLSLLAGMAGWEWPRNEEPRAGLPLPLSLHHPTLDWKGVLSSPKGTISWGNRASVTCESAGMANDGFVPPSSVHSFIHSLQEYSWSTEHLFCAKLCLGHRGHRDSEAK